jgi:predicted NUDIX family phosphoesterase/dephospho-CoA kinase
MKPREIVDAAKDASLFSDKLAGKTPEQTMKAKISVDIRSKGDSSRFVRTAPNTFYLRSLLTDPDDAYVAERQTPPSLGELVLAFPSAVLDRYERFQGITRSWRKFLDKILTDATCRPTPRFDAEQAEDHKQLLTYVLVTRGKFLLSFRRGTFNRVEDYLRGSLCIGFGGHVSESDRTLYNRGYYRQVVFESAARELSEELRLPEADRKRLNDGIGIEILGILNDDSSSTGRKHIAIVLRYEVSSSPEWERPSRGEKSITQLKWLKPSDLDYDLREFEYWSQLCLTEFYKTEIRTQPSFLILRRTPFRGKHHILCVIGGIGSGKSAATQILTREFGYREVNSGRILAQLLHIPPVPITKRADMQARAWQFISSKNGPKKLASALVRVVGEAEGAVLIDGVRQRATLDALKALVAPERVAVLYVHTPPHIAYQFYRDRRNRPVNIEQFLALRDAPVESEVSKLIAEADAVLYNWTGRVSYDHAIRRLMREIS